MDTIASYSSYLLLHLLDFVGLNILAIKLAGSVENYFRCTTRASLYSNDLPIHDACYESIPLGYIVLAIVLAGSYFFYTRIKKSL